MDSPYISPTLTSSGANLLADFLHYTEEKPSSLPRGGKSLKLEDLLQERSVCVFGEPGYGKSRLLQELYGSVEKDGTPCVFIDLKQVGTTLITDYVEEYIGAGPSYSKNEWSFKVSTGFEVEQ